MTAPPNAIHPGENLRDTLKARGITPYALSKATFMADSRVHAILKGERNITADSALRLGVALGTSPEFWLGLQNEYDLSIVKAERAAELASIVPFPPMASE